MALSEEARSLFLEYVRAKAEELQPKLPPHPFHPKGRNAYAHLFLMLKKRMGRPYAQCSDSELPKMIELVDWYCDNPC